LVRSRLPQKRRAYARALGPRLEDSLVIVTSDHGERSEKIPSIMTLSLR